MENIMGLPGMDPQIFERGMVVPPVSLPLLLSLFPLPSLLLFLRSRVLEIS